MASLYIRDSEVNALVMKVLKASNSKKTEAVRRALQNEMQRLVEEKPLAECIAEIQLRIQDRTGKN